MQDHAICIEQLGKKYADEDVLKDINLTVYNGEYMGLVGVNGAGKTTLIKCILDFCLPETGTIRLYGKTHTKVTARECLVYLPEQFLPPYYLTGREFLQYMSALHNEVYNEKIVTQLTKIVDLDRSALKKPVRTYSKGMGQKLGLISCLMCHRELIIFDEPMSGLDPKARASLKHHLLDLKQEGKTLFFSTHLLNDVEMLCDRLVILHQGNTVFTGSVVSCCAQYQVDDLEQAYLKCIEAE